MWLWGIEREMWASFETRSGCWGRGPAIKAEPRAAMRLARYPFPRLLEPCNHGCVAVLGFIAACAIRYCMYVGAARYKWGSMEF